MPAGLVAYCFPASLSRLAGSTENNKINKLCVLCDSNERSEWAVNKKGERHDLDSKSVQTFVAGSNLLAVLAIAGCEGTDTREKVDNTVEELAGKKNLDRMDKMKKTINKAKQQQQERFEKTEESAEEK